MKTLRRAIIAILLIVLVCATFVACNDDKTDKNIVGVNSEIKPFAQPDPNNEYDQKDNSVDYSGKEFEGKYLTITLINSESMNNLFYDYKTNDFGNGWFNSVEELMTDRLERIREQVKNNVTYDSASNMIDPKSYVRCIRFALVSPSKENAMKYMSELMKKPYIRRVVPDVQSSGTWFITASDTYRTEQWGLDKIDINNAWELTTGSSSVTVGLIDSGIRKTHEDLSANIADGGYAATNQNPHFDSVNHGTRTAGIIGAVGNNGKGVSGVCWNVNIVSLKACIDFNNEAPELVINAIEYAKANNIKLLNFSGGFYGGGEIEDYKDALRSTISSFNGLIVVAAGNENYNIDNVALYPQVFNLDNIIVVGATDRYDNKASFSNYGAVNVDLFAPGESIYSTSAGGDKAYGTESGTSLSAPFVTGVAALILAREPNLATAQLKYRIMQNVDSVPSLQGKCVTGGRLNAKKAVENTNHLHNRTTLNYTNHGITSGHTVSCNYCDYSVVEGHSWVAIGPSFAPTGYRCGVCNAYTKRIPVELGMSDNLDEIFAYGVENLMGTEARILSDDVAIIRENGKYYIVVACDENGEIANDIVEDIKIPWLKDLIANEVSKVKDEKD